MKRSRAFLGVQKVEPLVAADVDRFDHARLRAGGQRTACPQSPLRFDVAPPLSEARARIRLRLSYAVGRRLPPFFDLITGATGFSVAGLGLERPGLKVFDFHPNIVFINAASDADYLATKGFYHDHERLLAARRPGKGARTLLLELLEAVRRNDLHTATVDEVNAHWRTVAKWT